MPPSGDRDRPGDPERPLAHIRTCCEDPDYALDALRDTVGPAPCSRLPDDARRAPRSASSLHRLGPRRSPTSRSRCSRPSPTRRSSPSRTCACSGNWRRATATSPRRWSSRPRPARSCGSSAARPPMSSRCSTRSSRAPRVCATGDVQALFMATTASSSHRRVARTHGRSSDASRRVSRAPEPGDARPRGPDAHVVHVPDIAGGARSSPRRGRARSRASARARRAACCERASPIGAILVARASRPFTDSRSSCCRPSPTRR